VDQAVRVAQDPADPADPADRAIRAIRAAPGDMNRVVATAATGRAAMTLVAPVGRAAMTPVGRAAMTRVGRAAMTRVGPADLASPGDTILVDLATLGGTIPGGPAVTTRVDLGDMTRVRLGVQSRAVLRRAVQSRVDLAMPADTMLVGRVLMGRMPVRRGQMPVRRPPTAEPPLRTRGLLHPTPAERQTPAGHRWDRQTPVAVATRREARTWAAATRPADRTLRLEAIRPEGAIPRRQ
jgi:hypothetical protein